MSAGTRAERHRLSRLLLSLPGHRTGRRVWQCELSTIDSAFLFAGALTVATYFDRDTADEAEIRSLVDSLYRRADWNWARDGGPTITHGWRPETGFIPHRWQGYDEGLLLYILGLGSPTHPLPPRAIGLLRPISGNPFTIVNFCTRVHYSLISFHICGSIFGYSRRIHAGDTAATTSQTAGKRLLCNRSTQFAIL